MEYVYGQGPAPIYRTGSASGYLFTDPFDNVLGIHSNGTVLEEYSYDPYGMPRTPSGAPMTSSLIGNDLLFLSKPHDFSSGTSHLGSRLYDPQMGRFISRDPIREAGGSNLYAYPGQNPFRWKDPSGLGPQSVTPSQFSGFPDWFIPPSEDFGEWMDTFREQLGQDIRGVPSDVEFGDLKLNEKLRVIRVAIEETRLILATAQATWSDFSTGFRPATINGVPLAHPKLWSALESGIRFLETDGKLYAIADTIADAEMEIGKWAGDVLGLDRSTSVHLMGFFGGFNPKKWVKEGLKKGKELLGRGKDLAKKGKELFNKGREFFRRKLSSRRSAEAAKQTSIADDLIASSRRPAKGGSDVSRAVQSLQKKIDRGSEHFGSAKTSEAAERFIREILEDAQTATTRPRGVDIRDSRGRGIRITDGVFDTFLEPGGQR